MGEIVQRYLWAGHTGQLDPLSAKTSNQERTSGYTSVPNTTGQTKLRQKDSIEIYSKIKSLPASGIECLKSISRTNIDVIMYCFLFSSFSIWREYFFWLDISYKFSRMTCLILFIYIRVYSMYCYVTCNNELWGEHNLGEGVCATQQTLSLGFKLQTIGLGNKKRFIPFSQISHSKFKNVNLTV